MSTINQLTSQVFPHLAHQLVWQWPYLTKVMVQSTQNYAQMYPKYPAEAAQEKTSTSNQLKFLNVFK